MTPALRQLLRGVRLAAWAAVGVLLVVALSRVAHRRARMNPSPTAHGSAHASVHSARRVAPASTVVAERKAIRPNATSEPWSSAPNPIEDQKAPATLAEQRERLFWRMARESGLSDASLARVRAIFDASAVLGQGNPALTYHPMSRRQCEEIRAVASELFAESARCGAKHMVPVHDASAGETEKDASLCIDQFEFPNLPCE